MILPRYATRGEMGIYKGVLGVDSEGQRVFFPNSYHREGLSEHEECAHPPVDYISAAF